jgi:hypothetical protein
MPIGAVGPDEQKIFVGSGTFGRFADLLVRRGFRLSGWKPPGGLRARIDIGIQSGALRRRWGAGREIWPLLAFANVRCAGPFVPMARGNDRRFACSLLSRALGRQMAVWQKKP